MNKWNFTNLLIGKDLRTIRQNSIVVRSVQSQETFDELFTLVFHHERPVVMRAIDAVEKVTREHPEYLDAHRQQLFSVLKSADHKELKWHIAQLIPRIELSANELSQVWHILAYWALNKNESKIVRVNALQGLFDLAKLHHGLKPDLEKITHALQHELVPSIQARLRKLMKGMASIAHS